MAEELKLAEIGAMTPAAQSKITNDVLIAAMQREGVAFEGDDNKSDLLAKIATYLAALPPAPPADPAAAAAAAGWGTPPPTPPAPPEAPRSEAEAGNGAGTPAVSTTLPPAPATPGAEPENNGPGQGRVEAPHPAVVPADAPAGAVIQAKDGTSDHHDATTAGSGPGGTAPDAATAARTGAPIAEQTNEAGEEITPPDRIPASADHTNRLARREVPSALPLTDDAHAENALGGSDGAPLDFGEMLRSSLAIDARLAAAKAPPTQPGEVKLPNAEERLAELEVEPHANEKLTDAIGSTHDLGGRPVVAALDASATPAPDGSGNPVYVGTAQPVERPDAAWRSNTAA